MVRRTWLGCLNPFQKASRRDRRIEGHRSRQLGDNLVGAKFCQAKSGAREISGGRVLTVEGEVIGCGCRCLSGRVLLEIIVVLFFASDLVHSCLRQHPISDQFDIYTPHLPLPNISIRHNGQGQLLRGYVCFCRKRGKEPGIVSVTGMASKGDTKLPEAIRRSQGQRRSFVIHLAIARTHTDEALPFAVVTMIGAMD